MTNVPDDLDDFIDPMADLSPEEKFYVELSTGTAAKLFNTRIWLADHIYAYVSMHRNSKLRMTINFLNKRTDATLQEIARELLRHYYHMYHLPRFFNQVDGEARLDMERFLDLVMTYAPIVKTLNEAKIELDRA